MSDKSFSRELVIKVKERLTKNKGYSCSVCSLCPFYHKECVNGLTLELNGRKISDKQFRRNVQKPYSYFDCNRAYEALYKFFMRRSMKI